MPAYLERVITLGAVISRYQGICQHAVHQFHLRIFVALERVFLVHVGDGHLLPVKFGWPALPLEAPLTFRIQRESGTDQGQTLRFRFSGISGYRLHGGAHHFSMAVFKIERAGVFPEPVLSGCIPHQQTASLLQFFIIRQVQQVFIVIQNHRAVLRQRNFFSGPRLALGQGRSRTHPQNTDETGNKSNIHHDDG